MTTCNNSGKHWPGATLSRRPKYSMMAGCIGAMLRAKAEKVMRLICCILMAYRRVALKIIVMGWAGKAGGQTLAET
jgi:hypothetical protein